MLDETDVERALVVCAHPDDVDFGAAGTVCAWADAGVQVSYCMVTDGDAGGFDPDVPRYEIPGIRQAEQTAAAAQVGVTDLHFLGYPDGALVVSLDLRRDLSRVIRQVRPQRVITQSPLRSLDSVYRNHPDHIATGEATCCAVYPDSRNPFTFTDLVVEGYEPWSVQELWIMGGGHTTAEKANERFVDITDTFDRKMKALRSHVSQNTDNPDIEKRMREWAATSAQDAGWDEGRLAERFTVMPTA